MGWFRLWHPSAIVRFAKQAVYDLAVFGAALAGLAIAVWLFILLSVLIVALVSSETFTSADVRDFFLYCGFTIGLIAVSMVAAVPFVMVSGWREQQKLAHRPLARPIAVWVTHDALYVLEATRPRLCRIQNEEVADVTFALDGPNLSAPRSVVVTADGIVFVADAVRGEVFRAVPGEYKATPIRLGAGQSSGEERAVPVALALDNHNNLIVADARGGRILRVQADGDVEVVADGLRGVRGLAVGRDGTILASEKFANRVLSITVAGTVGVVAGTGTSGFAGDGGPAARARLASPTGLVAASDGALYIADTGNHRVRKVDSKGRITTIAGSGINGISGEIGQALDACLSGPSGLALWDGGLYVADTGNDRIRVVRPDATIETVAGAIPRPSKQLAGAA